jgi:hypothetical protein
MEVNTMKKKSWTPAEILMFATGLVLTCAILALGLKDVISKLWE